MRLALLACLLGGVLAACVRHAPARTADGPPDAAALRGMACDIDGALCRGLRIVLARDDRPRAELLPDGRLLVSRGMLARCADAAEVAFVLAHEIAHGRLEHFRRRTEEGYSDALELEADAWAATRMHRFGATAKAGMDLLERLRAELGAEHPVLPDAAAGMRQLDARIAALREATR